MPIARSSIVGVVSGAVLLAGAVGFGVGLPELVDSPGTYSGALPELPDRLDARFIALSDVSPEEGGATTAEEEAQMKKFTAAAIEEEKDQSKRMSALYDDATVRSYIDVPATSDPMAEYRPGQMAITIVPGDAGLVIPRGPYPIAQSGSHYELKRIGDYNCAVAWSDPVDPATGQPTGEEAPAGLYEVECRAGRDGLTYDIYSTGLTPEEVVHYLDRVLELTKD